jgi:transcriptional regulator with XRE-family HTH domain
MDAQALGRYLRQAREARELTLEDAEATLKIRARVLEMFELGEFNLPNFNAVQLRGFLRNYANYLQRDPADRQQCRGARGRLQRPAAARLRHARSARRCHLHAGRHHRADRAGLRTDARGLEHPAAEAAEPPLPELPGLPELPPLPELPELPELPPLPELPELPPLPELPDPPPRSPISP